MRLIDADNIKDTDISYYLGTRYDSCLADFMDLIAEQPTIHTIPAIGEIYMKNLYFIKRDKGNVVVSIMFNWNNGAYHFVNLTSGHICSCEFETVNDAIQDMQNKKDVGEIIEFIKIE